MLILFACSGQISETPIPATMLAPTSTHQAITTPIVSSVEPSAPSPTPAPGIGSTLKSDKDGALLVYVPAGKFLMGSDNMGPSIYGNDSPSYSDNRPQQALTLDAFWIDQTEVTNRQYALCVTDGKCIPPLLLSSSTRSQYYGNPDFSNFPVINMDWSMALDYCKWAGRRLPSEAEWEKAARGTDGHIYPWGNDAPNDSLLNYNSAIRDTTEVGKYPAGKSVYGAYDMAGNVWEWVSSLYKPYPYNATDGREDLSAKGERVLRGGSWYFSEGSLRSIFRFGVIPVDFLVRSDLRSFAVPVYKDSSIYGKPPTGFNTVGFRCAMSANP